METAKTHGYWLWLEIEGKMKKCLALSNQGEVKKIEEDQAMKEEISKEEAEANNDDAEMENEKELKEIVEEKPETINE